VKVKKDNYANPDWWLNFAPMGEMEKVIREFNERKILKPILELNDIEKLLKE
jgi:signal recognition particle GTPase